MTPAQLPLRRDGAGGHAHASNGPEALNALTFEVYRELTDTLPRAARRGRRCGSVVLTGTRPRVLHGRRREGDHRRAAAPRPRRAAASSRA